MRPDERLGPKFLLYHDVLAAAGGDQARAVAGFRRHIATVSGMGYRFASMSEFLSGAPLGPRDAIVTVDDGARSFISCVWPVLREFQAPAFLFTLSGFMGLKGEGVEFMTWDDIAGLAEQGVEFGCHGVNHVPLDQVEPSVMKAEIADATEAMAEHGFAPTAFAYPFGRYDDATKAAVRDAGYSAAFSVMKGGYDEFEIRRRLFTGTENPLMTRFVMGDHFFELREAVRRPMPRRLLKQENPVVPERWGPEHFGVKE